MLKKPIPSISAVREGILRIESPSRIIDGKESLFSFYQNETDPRLLIPFN